MLTNMKNEFRIDIDPCIDVLLLDGSYDSLSLSEAMIRAHEIKRISYCSATRLDEFALFKLVQAFVIDIFHPDGVDGVIDLWEEGCFDEEIINAYFNECRNEGVCFDLFDDKNPFLQTSSDEMPENIGIKPVGYLDPTTKSGNNEIFYHAPEVEGAVEKSYRMNPKQYFASVTRNLMLSQFTGGGHTPCCLGKSGAAPISILVHAKSLFYTLLFNMPDIGINNKYVIPLWKRKVYYVDPFSLKGEYMEYLFMPTGYIALNETDEKGNVISIKEGAIRYGEGRKPQSVAEKMQRLDPCVILDLMEEKKNGNKGYRIVCRQSSHEMEGWMQLAAISREALYSKSGEVASKLVREALLDEGMIPVDYCFDISIYMSSIKGTSGSFSNELFESPVPVGFLASESQALASKIVVFIGRCRMILWSSVRGYVNEAISYHNDKNQKAVSMATEIENGFLFAAKEFFLSECIERLAKKDYDVEYLSDQVIHIALKIYDSVPAIRGNYLAKGKYRSMLTSRMKKERGVCFEKE